MIRNLHLQPGALGTFLGWYSTPRHQKLLRAVSRILWRQFGASDTLSGLHTTPRHQKQRNAVSRNLNRQPWEIKILFRPAYFTISKAS